MLEQKNELKNINKCQKIEEKMFKASLEIEKEIARKHLDEISKQFKEEEIIRDGVKYYKKYKAKDISIGRVIVSWKRPIFEGSIHGKTVYIYPADDALSAPIKGRASYETLSLSSLLATFVPFKIVAYMLSIIRGVKISESSVQRYTETTGQFAIENLEEIIEDKKKEIILKKDEILIASIDGSSTMINGNNRRSNKKNKKVKNKKNHSPKKGSRAKKKDLLRKLHF